MLAVLPRQAQLNKKCSHSIVHIAVQIVRVPSQPQGKPFNIECLEPEIAFNMPLTYDNSTQRQLVMHGIDIPEVTALGFNTTIISGLSFSTTIALVEAILQPKLGQARIKFLHLPWRMNL